MTVTRAKWPPHWGRTFEAGCAFNSLRAHLITRDEVLILNAAGAVIGKVSSDIPEDKFLDAIKVMMSSFEFGVQHGEAMLAARLRDLVKVESKFQIE